MHTIRRERALDALSRSLDNFPLVVLSAPMGYGKSTVMHALKREGSRRVLTVNMPHAAGHDSIYLWDYGCGSLIEQGSQAARALRGLGFPQNAVRLQYVLEIVKKELRDRPALLVLDDYQFADSRDTDALIESLARANIPGLRILLLSRSRPNLPLEEMRLKGLVAVFGQELLIFSAAEAEELFALHGVQDREAARLAWEFSEGWAAALWVSLQSYLATGLVEPIRDMEKLISETIFSAYAPEDQRLLFQLSVLDSFTQAQAAMVSGNRAAPERLESLRDRNAFISYDPASDRYRLHSIMRAYLTNRLAPGGVSERLGLERAAIYRASAECVLESGDITRAVQLFSQAGSETDLLRILQVFEDPRERMFLSLDFKQVARTVLDIPWSVRLQCPTGYISFILYFCFYAASRQAQQKGFALHAEVREKLAAQALAPELRRKLDGEMEIINALERFNNFQAMFECYERAYSLLGGSSSLVSRDLIWNTLVPHIAFTFLSEPGGYRDLAALAQKKGFYFDKISGGGTAGSKDLFQGEYLLETGSPQRVEHYLAKAEYQFSEHRQLYNRVGSVFSRARLHLALGNVDRAWAGLEQEREIMERADNPLTLYNFNLCLGYIGVISCRHDAIPAWLYQEEAPAARLFHKNVPFSYVVRAMALMARQNWGWLEAMLEDHLTLAPDNNLFGRIHALVLRSVLAKHVQGAAQAADYLMQAVDLARPDGILTSIAEYGAQVSYQLQHLQDFRPRDSFLAVLTKQARKYQRLSSGADSPLSARELEILDLAGSGLGNKAIAEALNIAPGSVSNSLSRVYAKLGVSNRTEAVKKCRETNSPEMSGRGRR
ncbi:MAG: LuxR C-terminal-related transcriptional regulator [Deltaproteobacteria bacterium]|jgi:LuxR family maltose regulon positive regulatory protein|nr:LuxR C-terminal-related transcriptional regulator [Deltaproteobacteria bacterium]